MTDRSRIRVGRKVTYFPTAAEATAGGGVAGDSWTATITDVLADGTVNLNVLEADGGILAVTAVSKGTGAGTFNPIFGVAGRAP